MARVWIVNDTSAYHAGCRATMQSLRSRISPRHHIAVQVKTRGTIDQDLGGCDILVVNGEGTMHHGQGRKWPTEIAFALSLAQRKGIRTLLINTVWQANPPEWGGVAQAARVRARDPWSAAEVGTDEVYPDLSLDALSAPHRPGPYRGKVVLGDPGCSGRRTLWRQLRELGLPFVDLQHETMQKTVQLLAGCRAYLTGQYHGVIAAAVAGVPFAAVSSNSWKIDALLHWAGMGHEVRTDDEMLAAARGDQDGIGGSIESFREFGRWLCTMPRMGSIS